MPLAAPAFAQSMPMPAEMPPRAADIDLAPTGSIAPTAPPQPLAAPQPALSAKSAAVGPDERASDGHARTADAIQRVLKAFSVKPVPALGDGDWPRTRDAIIGAYDKSGGATLWLEGDGLSGQAKATLARLRRADEDGLDLGRMPLPDEDWRSPGLDEGVVADIAISAAVIVYAEQASGGSINPRRLSALFDLHPETAPPAEALASVLASADPGAALLAFNPPHAEYARLKDILARLRAAAKTVDPGALKTLAPAARVASAGTAALPPPAQAVDPSREIAAVLANMEMWRWAPRDMGATHVAINVPDFTLRFVRDGAVALQERVIVGKPDTPTSIFSNALKLIIVNPAWHVPDSIINKEFLPKLNKDPDYLRRHGFETKQVGDKLIVVQPPGEANALGRILFMFPNDHAIYLHDTPGRGLFNRDTRAFSHGCVRLDRPFEFGAALLTGDPRFAKTSLEGMIGGEETPLKLSAPTPIHIQYFTRFVDDSGLLQRRADIYGLERTVADTMRRMRQD